MTDKKRVAILGAGVAGLVCIKECLEEGLEPVCFEQHDQIGGLWYYTDETRPNQGATIYPSLITNSSKELMTFSDFPIPDHYPPYMPHDIFNKYLHDYADHFDLKRHIQLNTKILMLEKSRDHEATGNWTLHVQGADKDSDVRTFEFPYVIVATGVFKKPFTPDVPGLDKFEGKVLHSRDFRHAQEFQDETVLVVGNANSAGDVAAEVSHHAKMVHLSVGNGTWVLTRMAENGTPRDLILKRSLLNYAPEWLTNRILKKKLSSRMDHEKFGLQSSTDPLNSAVMVNDEIGWRIIGGKVQARPYAVKYTKRGVEFEDGVKVEGLDTVIFATGYTVDYNFLQKGIITGEGEDLELYKFMWPVDAQHQTLAMVGCFSTVGAHPPCFELQARWVARVFTGQSQLPNKQVMAADVQRRREIQIKKYGQFKLKLNNVEFRDELADQIGVKPTFWSDVFVDPVMAFKCLFGTAFPVQYRLKGPHQWSGARQNILEASMRYEKGTKTRVLAKKIETRSIFARFFKFLIFVTLAAALFTKYLSHT